MKCRICNSETGDHYFCDRHWMQIPLHLRQQWWKETDYGKKPPSKELLTDVMLAATINE